MQNNRMVRLRMHYIPDRMEQKKIKTWCNLYQMLILQISINVQAHGKTLSSHWDVKWQIM